MATLKKVIGELRRGLSPSSREFLERISERPEVQRVIDADEAARIAERAELVKQFLAVDEEAERASEKALAAWKKAQERRETAEREVLAARDHEAACHAAFIGFGHRCNSVKAALEKQVREGADPRLPQAIDLLIHLWTNEVGKHAQVSLGELPLGRSGFRRHGVVATNYAECEAAIAALRGAIAACQAMQLEALTGAEVETQLGNLFAGLAAPLGAIGMRPPRFVDGEVTESDHHLAGVPA